MEHFHHAGGVPKLMAQLGDLIDLDQKTITGQTLREVVADAEEVPGQDVIRPRNKPIKPEGAMAVLHGNLAPRGAVIKHSAASPKLLQHTGRAVVFESVEDMTLRVDDPALDVTADDVLVLRNAGPKGAPGMPEAGYLPIPKKLAREGVKDMVRSAPSYCISRRNRRMADRWRWSEQATRSGSTLPGGGSICWSMRRSFRNAVRRSRSWQRLAGRSAVTRICSMKRFCRPTRAATSIS